MPSPLSRSCDPDNRVASLHEYPLPPCAENLLRQWPAYAAYLASFAFIGVIWVNHHQLFTRIAAVDAGLLWRNLVLLLVTSVLPFPTAVLSNAFQHGNRFDEMTASVFYGVAGGSPRRPGWLCITTCS
jgi:uncharacterized membrane protein